MKCSCLATPHARPHRSSLRVLFATALLFGLVVLATGCAEGEAVDADTQDDGDAVFPIDTRAGDTGTTDDTNVAEDTSTSDTNTQGDTGTPGDTASSDTTANDTGGSDTATPDDTRMDDMSTGPAILGAPCGASSSGNCFPGSAAWPSCLSTQCDGQTCQLGFDNQGYCTHPCSSDGDCSDAASGSVVGTSFSCVQGGGDSLCVPGSNSSCTSTADCSGGEVCKIGLVAGASGLELASTCQTPTQGGAQPGGACNDNPQAGAIARCENDMCLGTRCSSLCGGNTACGTSKFECVTDVELTSSFTRDICIGAECMGEADCGGGGFHCAPPLLLGTAPNDYISARCQFESTAATVPLGGACTTNEECETGWCLLETDTNGYCSTRCTSDTECASTQKCGAIVFDLDDTAATRHQAVNTCLHLTGSRTDCSFGGNTACSGGEVCRILLVGSVSSSDPFDFTGSPQFLCGDPLVSGGGVPGDSCSQTQLCQNDYCVTDTSGNSFCTSPCGSDTDCPGTMTCSGLLPIYDPIDGSADIEVPICVL